MRLYFKRHRCPSRSLGQASVSHRALENRPVRRSAATTIRIRRHCRRAGGARLGSRAGCAGDIGLQIRSKRDSDVNRDEWLMNQVAFLRA